MDGNFTAVHQYRENAHLDIKLSHGEFFMTETNRYKAHLAIAKEVKEVWFVCYTVIYGSVDDVSETHM